MSLSVDEQREVVSEAYGRYMHDTAPKFAISVPRTDEEKAADAIELREFKEKRERETAEYQQRERERVASLPTRPENTPSPVSVDPWGKNHVIGRVIGNQEIKLGNSGLVLPDTRELQDRPHACEIIKVAINVDGDMYPQLVAARTALESGERGPSVIYQMGCGNEWNDIDLQRYVLIDARFILGGFTR